MAFSLTRFKRLALNVALAFTAGALTAATALVATTPKDNVKVFVISVVAGACIAGVRAVAGFVALQASGIPAIPVDKPVE
jgi:hypothetical protein